MRAEKTLQKCFRNDPSEIFSSFDRGWGPPFRPKPGPQPRSNAKIFVFFVKILGGITTLTSHYGVGVVTPGAGFAAGFAVVDRIGLDLRVLL